MTQTGHKHPPRGANCEFALLTVPPAGNFVEIGAIDVYMAVFELDKFKSIISPHVCDAGGDAAVAFANGYGTYIKAAILKRADPAPTESPPASTTAHAAKPNAPPEPQTPKNACVPGTTQTCVGPGACAGGQACRPDGQGYTNCDCG